MLSGIYKRWIRRVAIREVTGITWNRPSPYHHQLFLFFFLLSSFYKFWSEMRIFSSAHNTFVLCICEENGMSPSRLFTVSYSSEKIVEIQDFALRASILGECQKVWGKRPTTINPDARRVPSVRVKLRWPLEPLSARSWRSNLKIAVCEQSSVHHTIGSSLIG